LVSVSLGLASELSGFGDLAVKSILVAARLEAVELEDSGDGIRSEFIKTPSGGDTSQLWDFTKADGKSVSRTDQSIFPFNLAVLESLCQYKGAKFGI
jgi:hypothetical protein